MFVHAVPLLAVTHLAHHWPSSPGTPQHSSLPIFLISRTCFTSQIFPPVVIFITFFLNLPLLLLRSLPSREKATSLQLPPLSGPPNFPFTNATWSMISLLIGASATSLLIGRLSTCHFCLGPGVVLPLAEMKQQAFMLASSKVQMWTFTPHIPIICFMLASIIFFFGCNCQTCINSSPASDSVHVTW